MKTSTDMETTMTKLRNYTELSKLRTFEDRFRYLLLDGSVSQDTFGFDRWMNQIFYRSAQWKRIRDRVIIRDNGCDLGVDGHDIYGKVLVHHMNPVTKEEIMSGSMRILDPEYLISVSMDTHNAIHYGDLSYLKRFVVAERLPNDTCPWK